MKKEKNISSRTGLAILTMALAGLAFTGCTTTTPQGSTTAAEQRSDINKTADEALSRLYETAPASREMVQQARGVLVFPAVLGASFVVGAEHGKGVLRVNGKNEGYYATSAGSFGFQAGAQSRAIIILFMTQEALDKFRNSSGWTAGVDATVAVAEIGANGSIDTNTAKESVVGFVLNNAGIMAGVSLHGTKIEKITL